MGAVSFYAMNDKPKTKSNPVGRPTKFDDINLDYIKKLILAGWTDSQVCEFFEVSERSLYRWKEKFDEFRQSLKDWKLIADEKVELSLYERACGYSHPEDKIFNNNGKPLVVPTIRHYAPDPTSMIFWLKNRQPDKWKDLKNVDHSGELDVILHEQLKESRSRLPQEFTDN